MNLGLDGQTITNHTFGYTLLLVTEAGFKLGIENDCTLHTSTGSWNISPESLQAEPEQALTLTNRTISSAATDQSGTLDISFTDGHHLTVGPDAEYEAWTLAGPDGQKVVCLPGGDLATWPAETR